MYTSLLVLLTELSYSMGFMWSRQSAKLRYTGVSGYSLLSKPQSLRNGTSLRHDTHSSVGLHGLIKSKYRQDYRPTIRYFMTSKDDTTSTDTLVTDDEGIQQFLSDVHTCLVKDILIEIFSDVVQEEDDECTRNHGNRGRGKANISKEEPLLLLLAVSGGCDSIALFHSIMQITQYNSKRKRREKNGYGMLDLSLYMHHAIGSTQNKIPVRIEVVHFDHCQRDESFIDRTFVRTLCEENDIPFHCFNWDAEVEASSVTFSQESARDWRQKRSMELLDSIAVCESDRPYGIILTAHHKDDSEETILLKLLRGVHITNISGISPINIRSYHDHKNALFGKPLLHVRKREIVRFLETRDIDWREDGSNSSNKYMRNRVRNELLPLVKDLVGGESALEKRLANLEEQSQRIQEDIDVRSDAFLKNLKPSISDFVLPAKRGLDMIEEEALHRWILTLSNNELKLGYEKLSSICKQIANHPDRQQWQIGLGSGWSVKRTGYVLQLYHNGNICAESKSCGWKIEKNQKQEYGADPRCSHKVELFFKGMKKHSNINFTVKQVDGNEHLKFSPPWRKGKSPLKVKDFLRGQKVPLHRRNVAPILIATVEESEHVCAVFVETICESSAHDGMWMTNAEFKCNELENESGMGIHVFLKRET